MLDSHASALRSTPAGGCDVHRRRFGPPPFFLVDGDGGEAEAEEEEEEEEEEADVGGCGEGDEGDEKEDDGDGDCGSEKSAGAGREDGSHRRTPTVVDRGWLTKNEKAGEEETAMRRSAITLRGTAPACMLILRVPIFSYSVVEGPPSSTILIHLHTRRRPYLRKMHHSY